MFSFKASNYVGLVATLTCLNPVDLDFVNLAPPPNFANFIVLCRILAVEEGIEVESH